MILKQALQNARELLRSQNIESPELTAEVILRHTLSLNRVQLIQSLENELNPEFETIFGNYLQRHLKGEPVAYIIGHKEFFGLDFNVDNRVLIPRPETELLVEKALELGQQRHITTVADIGTGCGTIAISLALRLGNVKIYATDVSALALELALQNSSKHHVLDRICFLQGNLLEPLPEPVDLIIANLPYVKIGDIAGCRALGFEPDLALNGGRDGLSVIRKFCSQVIDKIKPGGSILMEIGEGQSEKVAALLRKRFPRAVIKAHRDFAGIERVIQVN